MRFEGAIKKLYRLRK